MAFIGEGRVDERKASVQRADAAARFGAGGCGPSSSGQPAGRPSSISTSSRTRSRRAASSSPRTRCFFHVPRQNQTRAMAAAATFEIGKAHQMPSAPSVVALGEDVGEREAEHPQRDDREHHRDERVAGATERAVEHLLHADEPERERHDADERRACAMASGSPGMNAAAHGPGEQEEAAAPRA